MTRKSCSLLWFAGLVLAAASAGAQPLSLPELDELADHLACRSSCDHGPVAGLADCLAACPAEQSAWEKNGQPGLDVVDLHLALLEYWDEGTESLLCYEAGAVVPAPLCDCTASHTQAECADADGDGIPAWLEDQIGSSDDDPAAFCQADAACGGFSESCRYLLDINASICRPRDCGQACTAFHLESVVVNNQELILHLHYDYSPTPATVLNLFMTYDPDALALIDSRPLPLLVAAGKQVFTQQTAGGLLRVTVLGSTSTTPIPTGAIVELVFQRTAPGQTTVGFTTDDYAQEHALAPHQGEAQDELADDNLWGSAVTAPAVDPSGHRLALYYSFDDLDAPLTYSDAKDEEDLCPLVAECVNETQEREIRRRKTMLRGLQSGPLVGGQLIQGVSGAGVFLDGNNDHLELPLVLNDPQAGSYDPAAQSASLSAWFYFEPLAPGQEQLLLSHNGFSERTRFGLALVPASNGSADLVWFEGDLADPGRSRQVLAWGLPALTWTHLGTSLDAGTGQVLVYLDGEPTPVPIQIQSPMPVVCPQFESPGSGVILHQEADQVVGARPPETLWVSGDGLPGSGIDTMDPTGHGRHALIGDGQHAYRDPDYSPVVDKLVYASDQSGDFEIWIADSDGSNPRQITSGFGEADLGIVARRPRWAPDGSAIVFESNAYSLTALDNWWMRGSRLFYIEYDPVADQVAIGLQGGGTASELDYQLLLAQQTLGDVLLTPIDQNNTGAVWLRGRFLDGATPMRGQLAYTGSNIRGEDKAVWTLSIPNNINQSAPQALDLFAGEQAEVMLLSAYRLAPAGQPERSELLVQKAWSEYVPADEFSFSVQPTATGFEALVTYQPGALDGWCWDTNRNQLCDGGEDRDGVGGCDVDDCHPAEVRNLYLRFDPGQVSPDLAASQPGAVLDPAGVDKDLELQVIHAEASYVRVEVKSPRNALPIPAGAELARVVFSGDPATADLAAMARRHDTSLYLIDRVNPIAPVPVNLDTARIEQVEAAVFSPDGRRLALAGIQNARPVAVTVDLADPAAVEVERISLLPERIEGMDWERKDRYYPCQWLGGFRDPLDRRLRAPLRGGLDELKVYSYVREPAGFRSDAQRGLERLAAEGRDGPVESRDPTCAGSHLDCPPYQLCQAGQCVRVGCDPSDPYACLSAGGQCTLLPVPAATGDESLQWVCAAECSVDRECYGQACLNGPCSFCDATTQSCLECRRTTLDYGAFQIEAIEGCPDRNSFDCVEGSCVTECYAFEDGQARYLCDPAVEFCKQGRCVLFDWSWSDLAPATFSGLGETAYALPNLPLTVAKSQLYPVEVTAWGVEDYLHPPELLVEAKSEAQGAQVYGGAWFRLGRILIDHATQAQAQQAEPYRLYSPFPITRLRLRLINPPYSDRNAAASGLLGKDKDFCLARAEAFALANGTEVDTSPCYHRAPGSRASLGYRVGMPRHEAYRACRERGGVGCPADYEAMRPYLWGGQPAVLIEDVKVIGTSVIADQLANTVCGWEGGLEPLDPSSVPARHRRLAYGDASQEQSNQRAAFYPAAAPGGLMDFRGKSGGAYGLLNCAYADELAQSEPARLELQVTLNQQAWDSFGAAGITETANGCTVEIDAQRIAPCYEWQGAEVVLDPVSDEPIPYQSIDFDLLRSFGWDGEP